MLSPDRTRSRHGEELARRNLSIDGPDLVVGGVRVRDIVRATGTPAYIYDGGLMRRSYRMLAAALNGFAEIFYSVKANPAPAVIALFLQEGAGMEIASVGEYRAARAAGAAADRILFAGPAKRTRELEEVIAEGIGEIHLESFEEIERADAIATRTGRRVRAAIRINPIPAAQAGAMRMGGKPTAFGFDEEDMERVASTIAAKLCIELVGVHVYGGTQILDAEALVFQWHHAIKIAAALAAQLGRPLQTIDLGGGLGIPYYPTETHLNLNQVAAALPSLTKALKSDPLLAQTRVVIEPGRFLVGEAGLYVAEVNAVKQSRGKRFVVTDGGMHHHLAASGNLGQIIKRDYPIVMPARMDAGATHPATVAGPLCTPLDVLAREALLPDVVAGDLVAVLQSGAYGATASPGRFLSHPSPVEVLVENGQLTIV
jgi:diaminopimelate decarboxylase